MDKNEFNYRTALLKQLQSLPLEVKIQKTKQRITEFYEELQGNVYVAISGKDSHALLHLVRSVFKDVQALFVNTGVEYGSVVRLAQKTPNTTIVRPESSFIEVVKNDGWPCVSKLASRMIHDIRNPTENNAATRKLYLTGITSEGFYSSTYKLANKHRYLLDAPFPISNECCNVLKHKPFEDFEKKTGLNPFVGTVADESRSRKKSWIEHGCNNFGNKRSQPIAFWTEQDVLQYIVKSNIEIPEVYGGIEKKPCGSLKCGKVDRTGCVFCMYNIEKERGVFPNRFQELEIIEPKVHKYGAKIGIDKVLAYMGLPYYMSEFTQPKTSSIENLIHKIRHVA